MQGKVVEVAKGRKVLLFDEEDLQDTIKVRREHISGGSQGCGVIMDTRCAPPTKSGMQNRPSHVSTPYLGWLLGLY